MNMLNAVLVGIAVGAIVATVFVLVMLVRSSRHKPRPIHQPICCSELGESDNRSAAEGAPHVLVDQADMQADVERAAHWQKRFWQMHGVVEQVLKERDQWRDMWREHACQHLEGQAILEHKIVQMRMNIIRAGATVNRLLKERDGDKAKLVTLPSDLDPIDSKPVGQAKLYYEQMKKMLIKQAPAAFDALMRRDEIAAAAQTDGADEHVDIEVDAADGGDQGTASDAS